MPNKDIIHPELLGYSIDKTCWMDEWTKGNQYTPTTSLCRGGQVGGGVDGWGGGNNNNYFSGAIT